MADRLFAMASRIAIDPTQLPVTSDLAQRLRGHVEILASPKLEGRKPGTPGHREAANYIVEQFQKLGLAPLPSVGGFGQQVTEKLGDNLIAMRPAASPQSAQVPPRWLLIGAHYDHLGGTYLGADDNASAVAILLETARALRPLPHHPILFVAFNMEEQPYIRTLLMGSQHFVDHLPSEVGSPSNFHTVIIMDLMGGVHWAPLRNVVFATGAEQSPGLYRRVKKASPVAEATAPLTILPLGMHLVEQIPLMGQVSFSDYDAFRNESVPFLFLSAGRTPRYHEPSDLPDTLHYERMAATVQWLASLIQRIDQDTDAYQFEGNRLEFADEVASLRPLVAHAANWETRIPGTSYLSYLRMKADQTWMETLDTATPTPDAIKRLERLSVRMQCLLTNFFGCFLI